MTLDYANPNNIRFHLRWLDSNRLFTHVFANTPDKQTANPQYTEIPDIVLEITQINSNQRLYILNSFYPQLNQYGLRGGRLILLCLIHLLANTPGVCALKIVNPADSAKPFYNSLGFKEINLWQLTPDQGQGVLADHQSLF